MAATQETPAVANADIVSLQVSLPQLLDLALGTPDVGAVNFNILHNFLHVLLHQVNLRNTKVEYRGESAEQIKTVVSSLKHPGPAVQLHEYSIIEDTDKISQRIPEEDRTDVEILTEDISLPEEDGLKVTQVIQQDISPGKTNDTRKVIYVEPIVNGALPTALAYKKLEGTVEHLQQQFKTLEELATTPEVLERLKGKITDPITDVWQNININKRLDATEQGIDKLTTMIQDVIKDDAMVLSTTDTSLMNSRLDELENKVSALEQRFDDLQMFADDVAEEDIPPTVDTNGVTPETTEITEIATTDGVTPDIRPVSPDEKIEMPKENAKNAARAMYNGVAEMRRDITTLKEDVAQVQEELKDLNERVAQSETFAVTDARPPRVKPAIKTDEDEKKIDEKEIDEKEIDEKEIDEKEIDEIKDITNLEQCIEAVKIIEATQGKALHDVTQRVEKLNADVEYLLEKLDTMQAIKEASDEVINQLEEKMKEIEIDMHKAGETVDKLFDDKEEYAERFDTLLKEIDLLKTVKADKEDIEDALADKADTHTVDRKVSHDRFDAACDDLAHGLGEAIEKLTKQEAIWQQALDEVQFEMASKVDKMEMTPLKDFVHNKLKLLQEKLKIMAEARREIEAAGTKKLLRDVQCISCDKDVVMKTEEFNRIPRVEPFPCSTSMKPYLTYELDRVRKQQRKLPHSRNMIQFEAAMQEETKKIKTAREEMLAKTPRDHLSNRYCGGSHTTTTPHQRVMRMGHFLTQWGPETIQLTDGMIMGKDGQMYRSRPMPSKLEVCGPTCWETQICEETRPSTPAPAPPRKPLSSRRSINGSQKRNSRKSSKEQRVSEPKLVEPVEKIIEELEITPVQESEPPLLPLEAQDEVVVIEETAPEEEQIE